MIFWIIPKTGKLTGPGEVLGDLARREVLGHLLQHFEQQVPVLGVDLVAIVVDYVLHDAQDLHVDPTRLLADQSLDQPDAAVEDDRARRVLGAWVLDFQEPPETEAGQEDEVVDPELQHLFLARLDHGV